MTREQRVGEIDLSKLNPGDLVMILPKGKVDLISKGGKTQEFGSRGRVPWFAYYLLPLVSELETNEFEGVALFPKKVEMESKLVETYPGEGLEDIYQRIGATLASKGVKTRDVSEHLLQLTELRVMRDTGTIREDVWESFVDRFSFVLGRRYPGSVVSERKRKNPDSKTPTPRKPGKDGIGF